MRAGREAALTSSLGDVSIVYRLHSIFSILRKNVIIRQNKGVRIRTSLRGFHSIYDRIIEYFIKSGHFQLFCGETCAKTLIIPTSKLKYEDKASIDVEAWHLIK